jgi:Kef-type K+ transport system membrane component KefB
MIPTRDGGDLLSTQLPVVPQSVWWVLMTVASVVVMVVLSVELSGLRDGRQRVGRVALLACAVCPIGYSVVYAAAR